MRQYWPITAAPSDVLTITPITAQPTVHLPHDTRRSVNAQYVIGKSAIGRPYGNAATTRFAFGSGKRVTTEGNQPRPAFLINCSTDRNHRTLRGLKWTQIFTL